MKDLTTSEAPDFSVTGGGGKLNKYLLDFVYPVGSYFITENANFYNVDKVKEHFGGNWTQIRGCFLYGAISIAGTTGGSATHTHSLGSPNDTDARALIQLNYYDNGSGIGALVADYMGGYKPSEAFITSGTVVANHDYGYRAGAVQVVGSTKNADSMPPYRSVYMYRRDS